MASKSGWSSSEDSEPPATKRQKVQEQLSSSGVTDSTEDDSTDDQEASFTPGFGMGGMGGMQMAAMMTSPHSLRKEISESGGPEPQYNDVAAKLMAKMGYNKGKGLGKNEQGRVNIVEASLQRGRRGLGHEAKGFEKANVEWSFEKDDVKVKEEVDWLPPCQLPIPEFDEMMKWIQLGPKKRVLDDENHFCSQKTLSDVIKCKSVFDNLEGEEMRRARTKSNPYETIRGAFFLNRAAMKMANMDAVTDFMFTEPLDADGRSLVRPDEVLYFADVCAGPGGFSEYVLWRKQWNAKGFGFTLKGSHDFKLEDFYAASSELFEPFYGVKDDGDVYDPENLASLRKFVWESTDGRGLHFVMADGGFSVEGQENIQEILSKRLYLCQFLAALSLLREGGNFVCKLFDVFTPFSIGVIYLMYRAFNRVSLFKPVTSRPANSERYIVCQGLRPDSHAVHDYMFEVNKVLAETFSAPLSKEDVVDVVPLEVLKGDSNFFNYVYNSNEEMGKVQAVALVKIQTFAQNSDLHEARQSETREQCLKVWGVPDQLRTAPDRSEQASSRYNNLVSDDPMQLHHQSTELLASNLKDIRSVHDYRCVLTAGEKRWFLLGMGKLHVYKWDGQPGTKWMRVNDVTMELPRDTLVEAEFVQELRGEGRGQRRVLAVHIIDALWLCGVKVQHLHLKERLNRLHKFVKAMHRPSRKDLAPVRVKDVYKLSECHEIFQRLEMKIVKGSGNRLRVCYQCGDLQKNLEPQVFGNWTFEATIDPPRYVVPNGMLFIKTEKDPYMLAFSRSRKQWYWFNTNSRESSFQPPVDCVGDYSSCLKSRFHWKWVEGSRICDQQQMTQDGSKVSRDLLLDHVKKLLSA